MDSKHLKKIISIEIPYELFLRLQALAKSEDRTLSNYIRRILDASVSGDKDEK